MKIIALKGHGNSGKTSTLLELYNLFNSDPNYIVSCDKQKIRNTTDFFTKFTNPITKNQIAIYSEGDIPDCTNQAITVFCKAFIHKIAEKNYITLHPEMIL